MDFFNKLGKKASEAYKVTADKTGKIAKEAKIRVKIGDLKSQINDIYTEIGEVVYQKHIREEEYDITKIIEEKCTKIDVLSDEIDLCLKQCLDLKDKRQCPKCYTEIEKNSKFCPKCGQKQEDDEKEQTQSKTVVKDGNNIVEVEIEENENKDSDNKCDDTLNCEKCNEKQENENDNKSDLEKTVAVESDVDENHDETVEYLEIEKE